MDVFWFILYEEKKIEDSPLKYQDYLVYTSKPSDWINEMMWHDDVLFFF